MKRGLPWYQRAPRAMLDAKRAAKLTIIQAAVYDLVLDLIYDGGGETPNDPAYIAAHLSDLTRTKAERAVSDLIGMGKLHLSDGMLTNDRATVECGKSQKLSEIRAEIGQKGGQISARKKAKALENNDAPQPIGQAIREDKIREDSEAKASAQSAPAIVEIDPAKVAWDTGRAMLSAVGMSSAQAGQFLGKLGKDHGRAVLIEAIGVTYRTGPPDPRAFLAATCQSIAKRQKDGSTPQQSRAAVHDATREFAVDLERHLGRLGAGGFG